MTVVTELQAVEVLTPREVATRLKIGRTQVYALLARGEIPSFRVGRAIRIRAEMLDRLMGL